MQCVFCDIIDDPHNRATVVEQWYETIAFAPLNPVTPGHVLVVPRRHVADAAERSATTAMTMMRAAQLVQRTGDEANLITSIGASATQTVFHLHIHVVPRASGDGLPLPWTPQQQRQRQAAQEEGR